MAIEINQEKLIEEALEQFDKDYNADEKNRKLGVEDLRFIAGEQWPKEIYDARVKKKRPTLTINRHPAIIDVITGEMRQNKVNIDIVAVGEDSDPKVAEIIEGIIRNIEYESQADTAYDNAKECAAECGRGFFRIITEYNSDDTFEQDIKIKRIADPFCVTWDSSAAELDLSDAKRFFISYFIDNKDFEKRYKDKELIDFKLVKEESLLNKWVAEGKIRIAEYWRKHEYRKQKMFLFSDNTTMNEDEFKNPELFKLVNKYTNKDGTIKHSDEFPDDFKPVKWREISLYRIEQFIISGKEILEGPKFWPGKYIPIIPVWGKEINILGERILRGIIRDSKDSARMYNYWASRQAEGLLVSPRTPLILTEKMIKNYENMWNEFNDNIEPYIFINAVSLEQYAQLKRIEPPSINIGASEEREFCAQEIKETTGVFRPSLGDVSPETAGVAIRERKIQTSISMFAYFDNFVRSIIYLGVQLLDLLPKVIDTERVLKLIGKDGKSSSEKLTNELIEKFKKGKFTLVVKPGPGYTTQRQEAVDSMNALMKSAPGISQLIADLVVRNLDFPGADRVADRIERTIPIDVKSAEEIKKMIEKDKEKMELLKQLGVGGNVPEENIEKESISKEPEVSKTPERLEIEQLEIDKLKLENEKLRADLQLKGKEIIK